MCTLIVLHRCVAGRPLVVAANRDEFLARPAEDFAIRESRTGPILSPLDLEAGGTWVGLSRRGVFAGLTNLRPLFSTPGGVEDTAAGESGGEGETGVAQAAGAGLKSRGDVVMMALEAESAVDAMRSIRNLERDAYNPFQLLIADGQDAFLVVYRDRPRVVELEPGPHVVGNVEDDRIAAQLGTTALLEREEERERESLAGEGELRETGATDSAFEPASESAVDPALEAAMATHARAALSEPRAIKLTRIRQRVDKMVTEPSFDFFEGLARICREHVGSDGIGNPFQATCVHIPGGGESGGEGDRYGTRSSLLLELAEDEGSSRLWTTDGPPCERPFENRSSLLKDLGVRLGTFSGTETVRGRSVEKNR